MTQLSDTQTTRQRIRQQIRQQRRALTAEQQAQFARQGADRVMAYPPVAQAQTVALFLSFDGELDTRPLIDRLWQAGKQVYLPVLHPFSPGNLLFLHYHPRSELVTNRLKIDEPKLDVRDVLPLSQLDVLIVRWLPLMSPDSGWEWEAASTTEHCRTGRIIPCSLLAMPTIASRSTRCQPSTGIFRCPR